jgi:hypothetical protein
MRARNLKPGFFKNEVLAELHPLTRIFFEGLWCMADREGRLECRPKKMKAEILPYDRADPEKMLDDLAAKDFIAIYEVGEEKYVQVLAFKEHQSPHPRESASVIPALELGKAKALPSREKALPSPALSLHSPSLHSESPSPLPALKKEGEEGTLPQNVKGALARATALRPLPPDKFFSEMVKIYGEADLAKQLIECHVWLTGKPERKPKSVQGCRSRIAKWMLQAEKYGQLKGIAKPQGPYVSKEEKERQAEYDAEWERWEGLTPEEQEKERAEVKRIFADFDEREKAIKEQASPAPTGG